jgi:hypothetical protein
MQEKIACAHDAFAFVVGTEPSALPNAQVQLQRIQIRVRAKPAHINSDPLSAATFVS